MWRVPRPLLWVTLTSFPRSGRQDRDKAKDKHVRSLWKLLLTTTAMCWVCGLAQLHHQHHHRLMLPSLLQSLQDLHQEMACIL